MGISISELLLLLLIVAVVFGTKRLRTVGSDLGAAIKGFRSAVRDQDRPPLVAEDQKPIEGETLAKHHEKT